MDSIRSYQYRQVGALSLLGVGVALAIIGGIEYQNALNHHSTTLPAIILAAGVIWSVACIAAAIQFQRRIRQIEATEATGRQNFMILNNV